MERPKVKLTGENGNTLNLLSICTRALKKHNQHDKATELTNKVFNAHTYDAALRIMMEYCEII